MERDSVIPALRESIDKTVVLEFAGSETQTASIILVNDEGFIYDPIASNGQMPKAWTGNAFWATFDEIAAVSP